MVEEWLYPVPLRLWTLIRRRDDDDDIPLPLAPGQWVIEHYRSSLSYGITWREGKTWQAVLYPWLAERIPPGEWQGRTRTETVERLWSACLASGDKAFAWTRRFRST